MLPVLLKVIFFSFRDDVCLVYSNFQFVDGISTNTATSICVSETEADDSYETPPIDICETGGEEGVRSDGSDSGLGSEPSTILPSPITLRPINCKKKTFN